MSMDSIYGNWKHYVDKTEHDLVTKRLSSLYGNDSIFPAQRNVFRAFRECRPHDVKVVIIGKDPYSKKGYATGIAFANPVGIEPAPSLKVIKDSVSLLYDNTVITKFDNTLESWCRQGILLINCALTVEEGNSGSHMLLWYPYMRELLKNFSSRNKGVVYMLLGSDAVSLGEFIDPVNNCIMDEKHPSWYARTGNMMPSDIFKVCNKYLKLHYNTSINWMETF